MGVGEALDFITGEKTLLSGFGAFAQTAGGIVGADFPCDGKAEHLAQHLADPVGCLIPGLAGR